MRLNGLNGIVYLMFLGRETYVREWAQKFEKVGLVKNESNVNSAVTRLEKAGIINEIKRLENKRGVPVIRTSNFQSFFSLIKVAKPEIEQETLERIKEYIKGFGKAIHFFPDYMRAGLSLNPPCFRIHLF